MQHSQGRHEELGVVPNLPADIARNVCRRLSHCDLRGLRLVSRNFRSIFRICSTTVAVHTSSPPLQHDLLEGLPEIRKLKLRSRSDSLPDNELQQVVALAESASPALLGQVEALRLEINLWDAPTMQILGSRCTSLESLTLVSPYITATFHGTGTTAAERRAHLRRHLATPAPTPALLQPPSPVAHACLTDLTLDLATLCPRLEFDFSASDLEAFAQAFAQPLDPRDDNISAPLVALVNALPQLPALTHLRVSILQPPLEEEVVHAVLLTILPKLPQLLHLDITLETDIDRCDHIEWFDTEPTAAQLAPLTRLTHLAFGSALVDVQHLSHLVNLRHLEVDRPRLGDATHLYPLTALTALSLGNTYGNEAGDESYDVGNACTLTRALPDAWRTGLRSLAWLECGQMDPAVLGLLTALTSLSINHQQVTSELVWALAKMPHLQALTVQHMEPQPGWQLSPPPLSERPVLPSLQIFTHEQCDARFAGVLASLTRLPPGREGVLMLYGERHPEETHPAVLQHWSPCWLEAALGRSYDTWPLLFQSQEDVDMFCTVARRAAARDARDGMVACQVPLHVTSQVPQAAVLQLAAVASELCKEAHLTGWELQHPDEDSYHQGSPLADFQFAGLPAAAGPELFQVGPMLLEGLPPGSLPNLLEAAVDCSSDVDGAALRVLLAAAPNVKHLTLCKGTGLPAADLMVLCEHAPLKSVCFSGVAGFLGEAAAAIEALLQRGGCSVKLRWAEADAMAAAEAEVKGLFAAAGGKARLTWIPGHFCSLTATA